MKLGGPKPIIDAVRKAGGEVGPHVKWIGEVLNPSPAHNDMERFWNKVKKTNTCWLWQGAKCSSGYGSLIVGSRADGTRRVESAHRLSWTMTNGPIPSDQCVLHTCDVRNCVRPSHLWLGDIAANNADRDRKGRASGGRTKPMAKLQAENIPHIRQQRAIGTPLQILASQYGVSEAAISMAATRKTWRNIP